MTDTPEAVRLPKPFGYLCDWGNDAYGLPRQIVYYGEPGSATEDDWNESPNVHRNTPIYTAEQVSALLRRFPDLEAEVQEQARLNGMGAERELALRAQVSRLEAENDQLRAELEGFEVYAYDIQKPNGNSSLTYAEWFHKYGHPLPEGATPLYAAPTPPHADQKGQ